LADAKAVKLAVLIAQRAFDLTPQLRYWGRATVLPQSTPIDREMGPAHRDTDISNQNASLTRQIDFDRNDLQAAAAKRDCIS